MKTKDKPKKTVPSFASVEEEAHFWDTHDAADYWDEYETVDDVHFDLPPRIPKIPGKRPVKVVRIKLGRNGTITIPTAIRRRYGLQEGSTVGCVMYEAERSKR